MSDFSSQQSLFNTFIPDCNILLPVCHSLTMAIAKMHSHKHRLRISLPVELSPNYRT